MGSKFDPLLGQLRTTDSVAVNYSSILSTTTGINGKTVANTAIYTVPSGKTAVIMAYVVRVSSASAITVGPAAGIGNIAGTDNISASQAMNLLTSTTSTFQWTVNGMSVISSSGSTIYFNLDTAAIGTSETLTIDLWGYLI